MFDYVPCQATFQELIDYCNKEICKTLFVLRQDILQDAKRSALSGGPCVSEQPASKS